MNLPQIAHQLAEIPIIEVRYGNHVLQRINSQLAPTYHFTENMTGIDLLKHFDALPNSVRNNLRNSTVINSNELAALMEDIVVIRNRIETETQKHDNGYTGFITLFIWFTLFYAIYKTMVFVFTVESSGEHISGLIYNFIINVAEYLEKMIL